MEHGGGHTGWSRSWVACMMARLGRGNEAMQHLRALIFQIDGNMGGTAAVCEMLMQSRRGELCLIPAIPPEWKSGSVKNFCAQDGLKVSFEWQDEKITSFTLTSIEDQNIKVKFGESEMEISLVKGKEKTLKF